MAITIYFIFAVLFQLSTAANITILSKAGETVLLYIKDMPAQVNITFLNAKPGAQTPPPYHDYSHNGRSGILRIPDFQIYKAGSYQLEYFNVKDGKREETVADLLLGELTCNLNYPNEFFLDNDCKGIEKDKIDAICRLKISSDTTRKFAINWRQTHADLTIEKDLMGVSFTNTSYTEARANNVDMKPYDSIECSVPGTLISCSATFNPRDVLFAKNKTARELTSYHNPPMMQNTRHSFSCKANISPSFDCQYYWIHWGNHMQTLYRGAEMSPKDFNTDGYYDCFADCSLKSDHKKRCVLLANRVEYSNKCAQVSSKSSSSSYYDVSNESFVFFVLILISITLATSIVLMMIVLMLKRYFSQPAKRVIKKELPPKEYISLIAFGDTSNVNNGGAIIMAKRTIK